MCRLAAELHAFPRLPTELRLAIWNLAVPQDRTVSLACERESTPYGAGTRRYLKSFTSSTPVPALLHTCRESRLELLRTTYHPMFRTLTSPTYTYVSFARDTVYCEDTVLQYIGGTERTSIESMMIGVRDIAYFGHYHMETLLTMDALRRLELVLQGRELVPWGTERYVDNLIRDIDVIWRKAGDWDAPRITITDSETSKHLWVFDGGLPPAIVDEG